MNGSNNDLISLQGVSKRYGDNEVLSEATLTIERGEFVVIRGSNGSGKSTLLKIVSGLIPFSSGARIEKLPQSIIGYTPDRLTPIRMTSTEYLTHMGKISKLTGEKLQVRIRELHQLFQLEQSKSVKMTAFSKGMLQKLNLMQAMLKRPHLLVLDEPFSGLDKQSVQHLLAALQTIKAQGTAILAAVHDPSLASQFDITTYWIRNGILEAMNRQENAKASYVITVEHNELVISQLVEQFPDAVYRSGDNGIVTFTVNISECIQREIELISLQKQEVQ